MNRTLILNVIALQLVFNFDRDVYKEVAAFFNQLKKSYVFFIKSINNYCKLFMLSYLIKRVSSERDS